MAEKSGEDLVADEQATRDLNADERVDQADKIMPVEQRELDGGSPELVSAGKRADADEVMQGMRERAPQGEFVSDPHPKSVKGTAKPSKKG